MTTATPKPAVELPTERDDLSLLDFFRQFPDDTTAEAWFISRRWPNGICCPHCESAIIELKAKHPTMPYRCTDCKKYFSVKVGSIMHGSKLGYQKWALALYLLTTSKKGISAADLGRKLGTSRKAAWHMAHRIRETFDTDTIQFNGTVEADETYVGGIDRNRHHDKKRGYNSKTPVLGIKERESGRVQLAAVSNVTSGIVQSWLGHRVSRGATLYTDGSPVYKGMDVSRHNSVNHAIGQYVRGDVHTNGVEGFWATIKRSHKGTYHSWSERHLHRYLREFAGRFNSRSHSTLERISALADSMDGKRLPYSELTSGALTSTGLTSAGE